ncbi:MAG: right-handed parallel beta-helix repeat-containing protein, partial [Thermoguttaceae bacterium]|nr:right-handed parallel beta-helix repeat-containing protein [Thermoguttaceae bacterium]
AGGGVYVLGTLTATNVTVSGNASSDQGGGIYVETWGTLKANGIVIRDNSAVWGGGAIVWGKTTLANALVVGNEATSGGGGFYVGGNAVYRNATIAGNKAAWGGGLQVSNDGTATLYNVILATNKATNSSYRHTNDVNENATTNAYNVLSSYTSWDASQNAYVYNASQPLFMDAANGDYTLAPGSQALNKGNDAYAVDADGNVLTTDLAGRNRFVGTVDLGAYEYQLTPLTSVTLSGTTRVGETLTANVSPSGATANAFTVTDAYVGKYLKVVATGSGDYTGSVSITSAQVWRPETPSLVVTTSSDVVDEADGLISLREAIQYAETDASLGGVITFDASLKGKTITLSGTQLKISKGLTVDASALYDAENDVPGITVDADGKSRVFYLSGGTEEAPVELIGLTITGGRLSGDYAVDLLGGGVYAYGATNLTDVVLVGNTALWGGGAHVDGVAPVTFTNVAISDNIALQGGGGVIVAVADANVSFNNVKISGNVASEQGGGLIYIGDGGMGIFTNVSITGNEATTGAGGGVLIGESRTSTIFENAEITGNTATSGAAIYAEYETTNVFVNATIAGNVGENDVYVEEGYKSYYESAAAGAVSFYNSITLGAVAGSGIANAYNTLSNVTTWDAGSDNYVYNASQSLFVDAANGDYRLAAGSQALDKGNDAYAVDAQGNPLTTDLAGSRRVSNRCVDLGAYELLVKEAASTVVTTAADVVDAYDGWISLREAISYAEADAALGGVVTFDASLKGATITLAGTEHKISKAIKIDASSLYDVENDVPGITVDADQKSRVFNVYVSGSWNDAPENTRVELNGLTITGGYADGYAGGVYAQGGRFFVDFKNVAITANSTGYRSGYYFDGGGVYANIVNGGGANFTNVKITENTASGSGGGVYLNYGSAVFTDVEIVGNTASTAGGVWDYVNASVDFTNVTIANNVASSEGGGGVFSGTGTFTNVEISGNTALSGGGVKLMGTFNFANVAISENVASLNGGGVYITSYSPTFTNVKISGNIAGVSGGGVLVNSVASPTFTNVEISGNTARDNDGGGVYVSQGTPNFVNVKISNNSASGSGGGVHVNGGSPNFTNVEISKNTASAGGGVSVINSSSPTFTNVAIVDNIGLKTGGGVYSVGSPTFRNVTIAGNGSGTAITCEPRYANALTTFYNSIIVGEVKLGESTQTPASALAYNTMSHYTYCWINGYDEDAYN